MYLLNPLNVKKSLNREETVKSIMEGVEPKLVWHHFYQISQIPRCSGNEKAVGEYVMSVAKKNNLPFKIDEAGNIIVSAPASPGYENRPIIVLQGHLDMVCEKNKETVHDFTKDSLKLKKDGEWLRADGTTLGADNGIGVSYALALMEDKTAVHGPLELLFTVDEETGLTGAGDLKQGFFSAKNLINLDSEEEGEIFIGCAGGQHTILRKKIEWQDTPGNTSVFKIKISGLRGGHSGLSIHEGLGNSIKLLSRLLYYLQDELPFHLADFEGGSKHNAIPREAEALVVVADENVERLKVFIQNLEAIFKEELQFIDKELFIRIDSVHNSRKVFSSGLQNALIRLLYAMPHGVMSMNPVIKGLVETSTNMAIIKIKEGKIELLTSHRSSLKSAIKDIAAKIKSLGELAGFAIEEGGGYAPWQPDFNSSLLKLAVNTYKDMAGKEPEVKVVHAGLECGIIGEKYPGMDMISFGPTMLGVHSPDERVHISSVANVWKFLLELLKRI
jgi:dipeptidase D